MFLLPCLGCLGPEFIRVVAFFPALAVLPAFPEFFPLVESPAFGELTSLVATRAGTTLVDGDIQLVALNPNGLEGVKDFTGHILGQINKGVILEHTNLAHVLRIEPDFICNGSDDVPFLSPVVFSDFKAIASQVVILGEPAVVPLSTVPAVPSVIAS